MLFREIIIVYCENHMECGQVLGILMLKQVVYIVTTVLWSGEKFLGLNLQKEYVLFLPFFYYEIFDRNSVGRTDRRNYGFYIYILCITWIFHSESSRIFQQCGWLRGSFIFHVTMQQPALGAVHPVM